MIYRELHLQQEKIWIKQIGIAPVLKLWSHKKVWLKESGLVLEMKMGWQWEKIAPVLSCFDVLLSVGLLFVIFFTKDILSFFLISFFLFFSLFFTHIGNHISLLQGYSLRNHQQSSFNLCGLYFACNVVRVTGFWKRRDIKAQNYLWAFIFLK